MTLRLSTIAVVLWEFPVGPCDVAMMAVLVSFPIVLMKYSAASSLWEEGSTLTHSSKVLSIMRGKSRFQNHEEAVHITTTVIKQSLRCLQFLSSLSPSLQSRITAPDTLGVSSNLN